MVQLFEVVDKKVIHAGRFEVVCEEIKTNGEVHPFSYVKVKNCAAAICMVGEDIILLRQYRHILGTWEWEIPAGSVEEGEKPEDTIIKEIEEETGYKVDKLSFLGWYHLSVGSTTEKVFLFYAECSCKKGQQLEALEKIEVHKLTVHEFEKMIESNEIHQCMGITAWQCLNSKGRNK